jgi:hypothetical protein
MRQSGRTVMRIRSLASCLAMIVSMTFIGEAKAASPYAIDGLRLGTTFNRTWGFQCKPSEQFADCTFCRHNGGRGRAQSITKVLYDRNGALGYMSREVRPALFGDNDIPNEIKRLSSRFGPVARQIRVPDRDGIENIRIAIWGELELEEIEPGRLAEMQSPRAQAVLIDHLGDIERSKRLGMPVYRLKGGPGFLWLASSDEDGRGHLRFLMFDATVLTGAKIAAKEPAKPALYNGPGENSAVIATGTISEAGNSKNEKKRMKAEDRMPQTADQDASLVSEQRRIIAAERLATEERAKARLAWERHEAEKAAIAGRERVTWILTALSVLLLFILGLIHRMHQHEQKSSPLRRLLAMASLAQVRAWMGAISRPAKSMIDRAIVHGRAALARSHSLIASHSRS